MGEEGDHEETAERQEKRRGYTGPAAGRPARGKALGHRAGERLLARCMHTPTRGALHKQSAIIHAMHSPVALAG